MASDPKENKFQDMFTEELRRLDCYVHSQAASMFMSGQPDLHIYNTQRFQFTCELKMWRLVSQPQTTAHLVKLLRGPQINVITKQIWRRNFYCPIIAQDASELDFCYHGFKELPVTRVKWKELASRLANLSLSSP